MKIRTISTAVLLALLPALTQACSGRGPLFTPSATPTYTSAPTQTLTATSTIASTPTKTLTPTLTNPAATWTASITLPPTITVTPAKIQMGTRLENLLGYSFRPPEGYIIDPFEWYSGIITLYNFDHFATIYIYAYIYPDERTVDQVMERELQDAGVDPSDVGIEGPTPVTIGGVEGLAAGWSYPSPISEEEEGGYRIAVIPLENGRFFFLEVDNGLWHSQGYPTFQAIAGSVKFFTPQVTPCEPAIDDETYGLAPENPIRIGGEAAGLARIEKYLGAVGGPGGMEPLLSKRTGSRSQGGTTLDVYLVHYVTESEFVGPDTTLYFDRYSYERPRAPAGFVCMGMYFPLAEP